jgi:putative ABC transport system substrate-binding protein
MKKSLKVLAALAMCVSLGACSSSSDSSSDASDSSSTDASSIKIGVVQYAEHPALDNAYEGFKDYLLENGYSEDNIDFKNAQGDQSNCSTIAQAFVNDDVDLIYAIATPPAQAAANLTDTIPIVVSAVTDPETSGLVESNEQPNTNVTGASDLTPVEDQMDLLKEILPDAKKIAIMYCNAEDNSVFQAQIAEEAADALGLEWVEATVTDSNQIQQVTESLIGKVDAIYIPTDNLLAEGMTAVAQVANENGIPTIVGEEGMVSNGGLATYGIDYYELGKLAGEQAVAILNGESDPKDMAIAYLPGEKCTLTINQSVADKLGITIPSDLLDRAEIITEEE